MRNHRWLLVLCTSLLALSCGPVLRPSSVSYEDYRISPSLPADSALVSLVQPYRDQVSAQMNEVVGQVSGRLEKKQPNCDLGNFMADAMRISGSRVYGINIDVAFVNYGGIRLNELNEGPITRGKVFELMPFDNLLLVQQIKGSTLRAFLDMTASRNGWPVSGLTYGIREGQATDIRVGGKDLDNEALYYVANSDFVINGGDNMVSLKSIPALNKGYLVRDAILEYVRQLAAEGKPVVSPETRVFHAR